MKLTLEYYAGVSFTATEAAQLLHRSVSFVRSACRSGKLDAFQLRPDIDGARGWSIGLTELVFFAWVRGLPLDTVEVERVILASYPADYIQAAETNKLIEYLHGRWKLEDDVRSCF